MFSFHYRSTWNRNINYNTVIENFEWKDDLFLFEKHAVAKEFINL